MKFTIENGCFAYDASRTLLKDVCVQLGEAEIMTVLGANGVEQVVELPLTDAERAKFHECCEGIRHNMEHLKEI